MSLPAFLEGVRVVDLSQYLPGPFASLLLADLGAEVIKVEPPNGDAMRDLGPRDAAGTPLFHAAINAGKTIVRLDLKSAAGRERLHTLVAGADMLIEGGRPGALGRLGIDAGWLERANPRLIICSISGHGANGPEAMRAGHDANYLAVAGMLYRNGDGRPMAFDPPLSDFAGALYAAVTLLAALRHRDRGGRGCTIDLGLVDAAMALQLFQLADLGATGHDPRPGTTYLNGGLAGYRTYATADGRHVALGAIEPKFWERFCKRADRVDWIDRRYDPEPQLALTAELASWFATRSTIELAPILTDGDCCLTLVATLAEAMSTPQSEARGLVRRDPAGGLQALFPAWIDGVPPSHRTALRER